VENGRVFADWFTGQLRVADGKLVDYVHMSYDSTFSRELLFEVKNGVVTARSSKRNRKPGESK
jgi:hypothetical protein